MFELSDILLGGLFPAFIAMVALSVAWKLTHCTVTAWTAGVVAGIVVGHWTLDSQQIGIAAALAKTLDPAEARDWLPLATLLAIVPAALTDLSKYGHLLAWLGRAVLCLLLPWRLLAGSVYLPQTTLPGLDLNARTWSSIEAVGWIGGIGATVFLVWILAESSNKRPGAHPWLRSVLAPVVTVGAAVTVAMSGSFTYAQLLGVLTAALAGSAVVAIILRLQRGPEATAGAVIITFGGVLVTAHFYSDLKFLHAVLLLTALAAALAPAVPTVSPRAQSAMRCVLCLAPLAIAILLAAIDFSAAQAELQSNPYHNFQP